MVAGLTVKETAVADSPKEPASPSSAKSTRAVPDSEDQPAGGGEHVSRDGAGLIQPLGKLLTPSADLVGKPLTPSSDLVGKPLTPSSDLVGKPLTPTADLVSEPRRTRGKPRGRPRKNPA